MGKPTGRELQEALAEAGRMRESGEDPHHVGKSLLNLNYRLSYLQRVLHAADAFLRYGQEAHLHAELLRAVEDAKAVEEQEPEADDTAQRPLV
ncbi:MAG: hypothetical protein P8076_09360 [Gammaproteobacteria bacterium]